MVRLLNSLPGDLTSDRRSETLKGTEQFAPKTRRLSKAALGILQGVRGELDQPIASADYRLDDD